MYRDIEYLARTDRNFRSQLEVFAQAIHNLEEKAKEDSRARDQLKDQVTGLLRHCNYNFGFLTGYFFPMFGKGPFTLVDRPFAFSMFQLNPGGTTTIRAGRQIGKSTSLSARELILAEVIPGWSSLYITPRHEQLQTFAYKLDEMERKFRFFEPPQNLYLKRLKNFSKIKLIYALTSADSARGNTADELLFDEYQNFDVNLELELKQIQVASDYPVTVYAGTSLTTDTALEARYENSSRGVWLIRCGCGKEVNMGDKKDALDSVQAKGLACPKCSRTLNPREGRWLHESDTMLRAGHLGFHVPQTIVPYFTENPVRWNEIYRTKMDSEENKFLQEVVGIPTSEGARELTLKNIEDICTINLREAQAKARTGKYLMVVSGCDWGGSDFLPSAKTKLSFTVHTVIGVNHDRTIDIIYFKRYEGMEYKQIAADIMFNHKALKAEAIASDYGVGQYYNNYLRENMTNVSKHIIFAYSAPSTAPVGRPDDANMYNKLSLNRTESITSLFDAVKSKRIRCFSWELAKQFLLDFTNLYRNPSESASGITTFSYRRHGSKADDCLHAVNFAYVLARLALGEPIVPDKGLARMLQQQLRGGHSSTFHGTGPQVVMG